MLYRFKGRWREAIRPHKRIPNTQAYGRRLLQAYSPSGVVVRRVRTMVWTLRKNAWDAKMEAEKKICMYCRRPSQDSHVSVDPCQPPEESPRMKCFVTRTEMCDCLRTQRKDGLYVYFDIGLRTHPIGRIEIHLNPYCSSPAFKNFYLMMSGLGGDDFKSSDHAFRGGYINFDVNCLTCTPVLHFPRAELEASIYTLGNLKSAKRKRRLNHDWLVILLPLELNGHLDHREEDVPVRVAFVHIACRWLDESSVVVGRLTGQRSDETIDICYIRGFYKYLIWDVGYDIGYRFEGWDPMEFIMGKEHPFQKTLWEHTPWLGKEVFLGKGRPNFWTHAINPRQYKNQWRQENSMVAKTDVPNACIWCGDDWYRFPAEIYDGCPLHIGAHYIMPTKYMVRGTRDYLTRRAHLLPHPKLSPTGEPFIPFRKPRRRRFKFWWFLGKRLRGWRRVIRRRKIRRPPPPIDKRSSSWIATDNAKIFAAKEAAEEQRIADILAIENGPPFREDGRRFRHSLLRDALDRHRYALDAYQPEIPGEYWEYESTVSTVSDINSQQMHI